MQAESFMLRVSSAGAQPCRIAELQIGARVGIKLDLVSGGVVVHRLLRRLLRRLVAADLNRRPLPMEPLLLAGSAPRCRPPADTSFPAYRLSGRTVTFATTELDHCCEDTITPALPENRLTVFGSPVSTVSVRASGAVENANRTPAFSVPPSRYPGARTASRSRRGT